MAILIDDLYEVKDIEKIVNLYVDAFGDYPKLHKSFPDKERRLLALKASLWFYCAYDLRYGKAYSLDENVNEAVMIIESENMKYNFLRHLIAGSYGKEYRKAIKQLTNSENQQRKRLFEELDRLELSLKLPKTHLYLDFLAVKPQFHRQGRGKKIMQAICDYGDRRQLPLMLFTNTEEDVLFYESLGFSHGGETFSKEFQFTNWYMVKYV